MNMFQNHMWIRVITRVITCDFGTCSCGIFVRVVYVSLVRFLLTLCSTMMTNWMATESEVKKQLSESQVCVIVEPDDITTKHISVGIITWSIYKLWYAPVKQDTIFTCLISKIILYVQQFSTWWRTWLNESGSCGENFII